MDRDNRLTVQWIGILLVFSSVIGLGLNQIRSPSLPVFEPLPHLFPGEISVDDAYELHRLGEASFWDVRSVEAYEKAHIPGSRRLDDPPSGVETLIVYCSGRMCPKAAEAARALMQQPGVDVRVMPDGINGWHQAGYPLRRSR